MANVVYIPRCGHTGEKVTVVLEIHTERRERKICHACLLKFFGIARSYFQQKEAEANQQKFDFMG